MATPIEKLVFAFLLASGHKGAERIAIVCDGLDMVISFHIDGVEVEQMRPPTAIHERILDCVRGLADDGVIHLHVGDERELFFRVEESRDRLVRTVVITPVTVS